MLYYLHYLRDVFSPLRIFQYITVRAVAGAGTAFLISVFLGPRVIALLRRLKVGQPIRSREEAGALGSRHDHKADTPTMGGVLIMTAVLISTLLWAVPSSLYIWLTLATMCFMGAVGFWDDLAKLRGRSSRGLSARRKLLLQLCWTAVVVGV
jgi:phospho-N-acetylmuramoyl-pentapeptide-transferase